MPTFDEVCKIREQAIEEYRQSIKGMTGIPIGIFANIDRKATELMNINPDRRYLDFMKSETSLASKN